MSLSIQSVTSNISGYRSADGRSFPCSGIRGKSINVTSLSSYSYKKTNSRIKFAPLKCSSRGKFLVCNAGTGSYRRNPELSRQNKFSRNRNRQNEDRESHDSYEESEVFSSKNGPFLSMSAPRFQATATPGPREREIVELFRKVQAQLRERAAVKEEKKREEVPGQGKENETVDSLLKLLRKHTTQQGKKSSNNTVSKENQNGVFGGDKSLISLDLGNNGKAGPQENETSSFSRPVSNFRRRSPVPRLNTLGVTMGRVDFAPGGVFPPHVNPRAGEIFTVLEGIIEVGFVTSFPENRLITKVLEKGDVWVFPQGLVHYQRNVGNSNAVSIQGYNSQVPGLIVVPYAVFGSSPLISSGLLAKAFQVDEKIIKELQSKQKF